MVQKDSAVVLKDVEDELAAVMPYVDSLGRGLRGNPRQIKRFLNIISLRRRLAEENELDVRQDLLIKLAVLEYGLASEVFGDGFLLFFLHPPHFE
jgi:hypothetical protein